MTRSHLLMKYIKLIKNISGPGAVGLPTGFIINLAHRTRPCSAGTPSSDCKTFTTQTFTTSDVHHPLCKIRRSPPQTFTTSDVHHLRRSPPQTFTTPDVHHPQCKIRRSPPQTFTTPDVHHLRHSPPQTFITSAFVCLTCQNTQQ